MTWRRYPAVSNFRQDGIKLIPPRAGVPAQRAIQDVRLP